MSGAIYKALAVRPVEDFQMISTVGYQFFHGRGPADSPIKTVADLVAAAKAAPGKLTYSSGRRRLDPASRRRMVQLADRRQMTHVP